MITIAALNNLDLLACDTKNTQLTAQLIEKIYTIVGNKFGLEEGQIIIINMAIHGLKSSGVAFKYNLAAVLHELNHRPSRADPGVWLSPATKANGFEYY